MKNLLKGVLQQIQTRKEMGSERENRGSLSHIIPSLYLWLFYSFSYSSIADYSLIQCFWAYPPSKNQLAAILCFMIVQPSL